MSTLHEKKWVAGRFLILLPMLAALVPAGCTDSWVSVDPPFWPETEKYTTTESHADFATFEFTRTVGWSADDLEPGAIMSAVITHLGGGRYQLDMTVMEDNGDTYVSWLESDDTWDTWGWDDFDTYDPYLAAEQALPSRELSAAEVQRMWSVFANVHVDHGWIEDMIDYYYWTDFRWDERSLSANPSYGDTENIAHASVNEIIAMLEEFRAASEISS